MSKTLANSKLLGMFQKTQTKRMKEIETPLLSPLVLKNVLDVIELTLVEYKRLRPVGPVWSYAEHWFYVRYPKYRSGYPTLCLNYNPYSDSFEDNGCPYCESSGERRIQYIANFIDRDEQKKKQPVEPEPWANETNVVEMIGYKCRLKVKYSGTWTPVRVVRLPRSAAEQLGAISQLNMVKLKDGTKKSFSAAHPKYGTDVDIKYETAENGIRQYDVQKRERTPLTEDELNYLWQDLRVMKPEELEDAEATWKTLKPYIVRP